MVPRSVWRVLLAPLALGLVTASCTKPGPRGDGRATVSMGGPAPVEWEGPCVYSIATRWATSVPHGLRLSDDKSDWSVVISSRRRFASGRTKFRDGAGRGIIGVVFDGNTVRGSVRGTLDLKRVGDSTFVEIAGTRTHQDTVALQAACRLGPPPEGGTAGY